MEPFRRVLGYTILHLCIDCTKIILNWVDNIEINAIIKVNTIRIITIGERFFRNLGVMAGGSLAPCKGVK